MLRGCLTARRQASKAAHTRVKHNLAWPHTRAPRGVHVLPKITVDWLIKHEPVVFTNRSKDQPLMADPFPIYQQVVRDNPAFFKEVHGYVPLANM